MPKGRVLNLDEAALYGYTPTEWASFSKTKRWRIKYPEKMAEAQKKWSIKNPEHKRNIVRKSYLKLAYSLTPEDYTALLEKQNFSCAICSTTTPTGKWKVFAVDHCHTTGQIRGLLCNECNRGIGLLKDNPILLKKAAQYLNYHKKKTKKEKDESR